jgi:8-oxo-dGTP diphosphatase
MHRTIQVVAAVITDADRILACRRAGGRDAAGRWEFPGGKVEPGEDPPAALRREIGEELGIVIEVGELLDRSVTVVGDHRIDLACYRVTGFDRRPSASTDHDQLRWCRTQELAELHWAEPDLPAVQRLTVGKPATPRRSIG